MSKSNETGLSLFVPPRLEKDSRWIGNHWIPPTGSRLYSAGELTQIFSGKTVLWIGDSTMRRAAKTCYGIVNATGEQGEPEAVSMDVVDKSSWFYHLSREPELRCHLFPERKLGVPLMRPDQQRGFCLEMPGDDHGMMIFLHKVCIGELDDFLQSELSGRSNETARADVIIVSGGLWDSVGKDYCDIWTKPPLDFINSTLSMLDQLQYQGKRPVIIWRTSGFHHSDQESTRFLNELNDRVVNYVDEILASYGSRGVRSNFSYVDWASAVRPRSFGDDRLAGDIMAHYGFEPRLVSVQMVANLLVQHYPERVAL